MKVLKTTVVLGLCACIFAGCDSNSQQSTQTPQITVLQTTTIESAVPQATATATILAPLKTATQDINDNQFALQTTSITGDDEKGTIIISSNQGNIVSFSLGLSKSKVEELLKNVQIGYLEGEDLGVTDVNTVFTKDLYFQFSGNNLDIMYVNSENIKTSLGLKIGDSKDMIDRLYGTADSVKLVSLYSDNQTKEYTHYQYNRDGYYFWILVDNETQTVKSWGTSAFAYPGDETRTFELWGSYYGYQIK